MQRIKKISLYLLCALQLVCILSITIPSVSTTVSAASYNTIKSILNDKGACIATNPSPQLTYLHDKASCKVDRILPTDTKQDLWKELHKYYNAPGFGEQCVTWSLGRFTMVYGYYPNASCNGNCLVKTIYNNGYNKKTGKKVKEDFSLVTNDWSKVKAGSVISMTQYNHTAFVEAIDYDNDLIRISEGNVGSTGSIDISWRKISSLKSGSSPYCATFQALVPGKDVDTSGSGSGSASTSPTSKDFKGKAAKLFEEWFTVNDTHNISENVQLTADELSPSEIAEIQFWSQWVSLQKEQTATSIFRKTFVIMGLMLFVLALSLLMIGALVQIKGNGYWSFGDSPAKRIYVVADNTPENQGITSGPNVYTPKRIYITAGSLLVFSVLITAGTMFGILQLIVLWVRSIFS